MDYTQGMALMACLVPGRKYRIKHKAGKMSRTHLGVVKNADVGHIRLETVVSRIPPQPMRPYFKKRAVLIYPEEIIQIEEMVWSETLQTWTYTLLKEESAEDET